MRAFVPAPVPALALSICIALAGPAAAIAAETALVCTGGGGGADGAHVVRVTDPLGERPVLHGAGDPLPVKLFKRGRTWVFDAAREALYYDRDNHNFSYTRITDRPALIWRGNCRMEG